MSTIIIKATNEIITTTKIFNILKFFCFFGLVFTCGLSSILISIFSLVSSSKSISTSSLGASDTLFSSLVDELFWSKTSILSILISSSIGLTVFSRTSFLKNHL